MITGRVAKVLNDREIIINRGSINGVRQGMRFKIFDRSPDLTDISDPDTGKTLGSFHRETVRIEIIELEDSMSIGRTYITFSKPLNPLLPFTERTTYYQTLAKSRTYSKGGYEDIAPAESAVQVGDDAIEIVESEEQNGEGSEAASMRDLV